MPPTKKRKLNEGVATGSVDKTSSHEDAEMQEVDEPDMDEGNTSEEEGSRNSASEASSLDTEAEISISHIKKKSKKTMKRKIRATEPEAFGNTLEALLGTSVPHEVPLALKPSVRRRLKEKEDERRSRKVAEGERREHEEVGRIKDVIGGWGGESERALRKVAQRGVVQLFNVIQKAQAAKVSEDKSKLALRGSGKPTLDAPKLNNKHKKKSLIAQKDETIDKDIFMDAIRSGGVVSKI